MEIRRDSQSRYAPTTTSTEKQNTGYQTRNTSVRDEPTMRQVVQPVKHPECADHYRRLTDAHEREHQANYDKRNTVDHLCGAHSLLTGSQGKERVQARQGEQTQCIQPTLPTDDPCHDYRENTYRDTNEGCSHDSLLTCRSTALCCAVAASSTRPSSPAAVTALSHDAWRRCAPTPATSACRPRSRPRGRRRKREHPWRRSVQRRDRVANEAD